MKTNPHPALVLSVYGEELANGARTAVFGSATLGLAEELVARGARLVHVFDPDAARVAEANARSHDRSIFFAPLPEGGDVGVRDGAFDFVLVPDLSIFADPASLITLVRRVVSKYGAALIASPNADAKSPLLRSAGGRNALGYYELYEAVAAHFASVRMIGQAPFVGYAVAELSIEDPDPTIDSSLAKSEGKEPDWFLALVSDRNVHLDAFALIELPVEMFAERAIREGRDGAPELEPAPGAAGAGTVLINILEAEREAALESLRQQEQANEGERFRAQHTQQALASAQEELALLRERCRALEDRVSQEEGRRSALEATLEQPNPELLQIREKLRVSEERARGAEDRLRKFEANALRAEDRLRKSEEGVRRSEEGVRTADERLRKFEESARGAEERARKFEESARSAEESARTADERLRKSEESARSAEEQLRKFEESARAAERAAEERVRKSDERARKAEESLRKSDEQRSKADQKATDALSHATQAEERLRSLEAMARDVGTEHEQDVARLETQLRERGREIQGLRDEVDRRAKIARELIMTTFPSIETRPHENGASEAFPPPPHGTGTTEHDGVVADLSAKLDRLAGESARREADLVGAKWKIAQLERDLSHPQR